MVVRFLFFFFSETDHVSYLAKDACMSRETFERMYPRLDEFREAKAILDPASRFASSLSDRLGLTGASS